MLAQYNYKIMHICGERNCSGALVSWWVNVPAVAVPAVAAFVSSAPDETKPSKNASRELQQQARTGLSAMVNGASSFITPVGRVTKDHEDLFRVGLDGQYVLWIPDQVKEMQAWLMVCDHIRDAGHRGS